MLSLRKMCLVSLALALTLSLVSCHGSRNTTQAANPEEAGNPDKPPAGPAGTAGTEAPSARNESQARSVTIPAGTMIEVRLVDSLSSDRNRSGDAFHASLAEPIRVNGYEAVPTGANVDGRVVAARPSGHLQTPPELSVTLTGLQVAGQVYDLRTSDYNRRGQSHTKHNAKWIGGLAGGGALLGALVGRGKGAAIGAGVGAGAGTGAAYATGKKDLYLPSETRMRFILREPVTINWAG